MVFVYIYTSITIYYMMILADHQIQQKIKNNEIKITPPPTPEQYQPSSLDLRLGNEYWQMITQEQVIDPYQNEPKYNIINANSIVLPPNAFILGVTRETISLPNDLCARLEGRSSIGRLGISIHVTAGYIDPGFQGKIVLEIKNVSPNTIMLHEGMRICQLVFEELGAPCKAPYGSCGNKYQGQDGVVGSLLFFDEDNCPR